MRGMRGMQGMQGIPGPPGKQAMPHYSTDNGRGKIPYFINATGSLR